MREEGRALLLERSTGRTSRWQGRVTEEPSEVAGSGAHAPSTLQSPPAASRHEVPQGTDCPAPGENRKEAVCSGDNQSGGRAQESSGGSAAQLQIPSVAHTEPTAAESGGRPGPQIPSAAHTEPTAAESGGRPGPQGRLLH